MKCINCMHDIIKLQTIRKKNANAQAKLHIKNLEIDKMIDKTLDTRIVYGRTKNA